MCLRSFKRRLGKHLEEGHVVGDNMEKLQQAQDYPWLKSVSTEGLLGEAGCASGVTPAQAVPTGGTAGGRVPGPCSGSSRLL